MYQYGTKLWIADEKSNQQFKLHMDLIIEAECALVNPDEKHQYRKKGDKPFKMICGKPNECEWFPCNTIPTLLKLTNYYRMSY